MIKVIAHVLVKPGLNTVIVVMQVNVFGVRVPDAFVGGLCNPYVLFEVHDDAMQSVISCICRCLFYRPRVSTIIHDHPTEVSELLPKEIIRTST